MLGSVTPVDALKVLLNKLSQGMFKLMGFSFNLMEKYLSCAISSYWKFGANFKSCKIVYFELFTNGVIM